MNDLSYEHDLSIDDNALDLEWLEQPLLMLKYTKAAAVTRREIDRMKEMLSVERARLDKSIRKNPEKYEIEKITESVINSTILLQKSYQTIQTDVIEAQYEHQMLQGAVQAVEHRKQALENMSKLLGLQYFAGPKTPRDLPYEVRKNQEKNRANKTVKIKRRK